MSTEMIAKHFYGAYRRGRAAFEKDGESASCPYTDARGYADMVTFSRAFQNQWYYGFTDARKGLPDRYEVNGDN